MSSYIRNIQRRILRANPAYEPAKQITEVREDGSYRTLRFTKGWLEVAAITVLAQMKMANILSSRYMPLVRKGKTQKPYAATMPKPVPQGTETRQQRRAAARGYVGALA